MKERGRAKAAPRAARTSDVTRARTLALAAAGAAVGAGAFSLAGTLPRGTERPLARPHVVEKVACAKCHDEAADEQARLAAASASGAPPPPYAAAGACKSCHGKTKHASARSAHRAVAARGELTCARCHPAHEGAQGITFAPDGTFVRWGAGAEAPPSRGAASRGGAAAKPPTVPLVALASCVGCHAPGSASDPIASCVPAEVRAAAPRPAASATGGGGPEPERALAWKKLLAETPSLCFDEHRAFAEAESRFVAWDAAREASARSSWVGAERRSASPWGPLGAALAGASLLGASAALVERRRRSRSAPSAPRPAVAAPRRRLPVVDPTTCLGCYACVDACPFDVLEIQRYVAVVARPDECCGVVLCEQVCPNGSLTIAEGEPVLDRPEVDEHLESRDVPGLYLAGDLTGLPLIKNAINQGVRVVDRIASTLQKQRKDGAFDLVIVGAGPAGLSAALRAQERGLSYVVLEQATVAASVKSFPRDKIVYDPPLDLPVEGELWLREGTKEELLAQWTRIVRARALDVREGRRVTAIEREGARFTVATTRAVDAAGEGGGHGGAGSGHALGEDETLHASRVVLAIGRRGTPRKLDLAIEPGAEDRVAYALADARSFAGKRVVVVGLGDSAMEAAVALARQPETQVTISYRGAGFTRGKSRNISEVKDLIAKGRLRVFFETIPVAVTRSTVTLAPTGLEAHGAATRGRRTLQADALLVLVGGLPSWDLLTRCGLRHPEREEPREQGTGNREQGIPED